MLESITKAILKAEALNSRSVSLYIHSRLFVLTGDWQWDFYSDAVFCSDVMFSLPIHFLGTRGIIHPDDLEAVEQELEKLETNKKTSFSFRIITTYGEIKKLLGIHIKLLDKEETFPEEAVIESAGQKKQSEKEKEEVQLLKEISHQAERLTQTGTWYQNISTNETYYSENVFRIYGLPPNGLNAHPNTFISFIHPEDKDAVLEAFDKALKETLPLHLEYRIIRADGKVRHIQQITHWMQNAKGEYVLCGIIQDATLQKTLELKLEATESDLKFQQEILSFNEQNLATGNWQVNLLTRKWTYSDNYYRIFGVKPQPSLNNNIITSMVHPDDREKVAQAHKKMLYEYSAPDLEYRIIRPDGKIKHIKQSGKVAIFAGSELAMIGIVQDVTQTRNMQLKWNDLNEQLQIKNFSLQQTEETGDISHWVYERGSRNISWSDSFYNLLGYKPQSIHLDETLLKNAIHHEDRKKFSDAWQAAIDKLPVGEVDIRLIRKNETRYFIAFFKQASFDNKEYIIGSLRDITEMHLLQQQLTERIQFAELLADSITDKILVTDTNNTIIVWNKKCEEAFEIKRADALYQNFYDLFPQWKSENFYNNLHRALNCEHVTMQYAHLPGLKGYQHIALVPLKNKNHQLIGVLHILHDVTREYELQNHLSARLNFIENLVEASVDRIIVLDRNMNYQYWNKKSEQVYGLTKEQVVGKNILELIPGFQQTLSYSEFKKALKGETVHIPGSENQQEETYLIPIKSEKGDVVFVLWIVHDLTKEFALTQYQKKAHSILDSLNEGCFELNCKDFTFRYINQKASEYWGRQREELLGKCVWDVFPQLKGATSLQAVKQACSECTTISGEFYSPVLKGWMYMTATPSDDNGVVVLFFPIQDYKDVQEKVRQSETAFRTLVENVPDAITRWDRQLKLQYANNAFVTLTGKELSLMPGKTLQEMDYPQDVAQTWETSLQQVFETNAPTYFYYQHSFHTEKGPLYFYTHLVPERSSDGSVLSVLAIAKNITEIKLAETQLKDSRHFLQQIADLSPDIIYVLDVLEKRIIFINKQAVEMFGHTEEYIYKKGLDFFTTVMHPEDVEKWAHHHESLSTLQNNEIREMDVRLKDVHGHIHWFKIRNRLFKRTENGMVWQTISIGLDFTAEKQAEESLNKSISLLSQTEFIAHIGSWVHYLDTGKTEWSEEVYRIFGYEPYAIEPSEAIMQKHIFPDDLAYVRQTMERAQQTKTPLSYTCRMKAADSASKYILVKIAFDVDNPNKLLGIVQDITKETELRRQLTERKKFIETMVDNSVDRIMAFAKDLTVLVWNKSCEEYYGVKREVAIGKSLLEIFPKVKTQDTVINAIKKAFEGERSYVQPEKEIYADSIAERFYIPLKEENGQVYSVLCILHDVTKSVVQKEELKELNKSLEEKNRELEEKNEEISSFAFVASHDLKEPLRKIHTYSHWLLEKEVNHLTDKGKDYFQRISMAVKRMDMLIEDIMVLTKIHSDRERITDINLNEVLQKVVQDLDGDITDTSAQIHINELSQIKGNENQIFYLFKNIIHNSLKFQEKGKMPVVTITAEKVHTHEVPTNDKEDKTDYLKVSVTDNGIGFDAKYAKKVFQVFQRLHTKQDFSGTGMGLAICKKIMENHNGFIVADSEENKGSVFSCYFPLQ